MSEMTHIALRAGWNSFPRGILACILLVTAGVCMAEEQGQSSASIIENIAHCNDFERFSYEAFSRLRTALSNDEKLGIARRTAVTKLNAGHQDSVLWEYRFTQPIKVLGLSAIGVGNSFGTLPALTVAFDAPLDSIKAVYGRLGFEFKCDQPAELKGTACEASRDVEPTPPGQPPLAFTVFLTDSPEMLQDGKSLAACTIMPRGGNVFR